MFDFIRSHQRLMQFVLLVLIVPSFALIGVSGYSSYVSGDHDLVKVGKSAITMQDYERASANQLRQMQASSQGGFDPSVLDDPQVRRALLDSLIDYRVLATTAASERFSVSDPVLRRTIASMPQLQVSGQFSPERYNEVLASAGMTTRDFEQSQRFELALDRVLGPIAQTASVPPAVVSNLERALTEARTIRMQVYSDDEFTDQVTVTDEDVKAWYAEHKQDFEVPEQASVQYLLLNEAAAMANLPEITEYDLQKYYDQNKSRFTQAGRINLSHIQVNVPAGATQEQRDEALEQANKIAAMLKSDSAVFADIAKEYSQDAGTAANGGNLGWITQGTWPAGLDQAVFALKQGQMSDVIDGPGGYHIFLANQVQPEHVQTFAEVHDTVQQEVKRQLGAERFADMATRLTGLVYDHPDSLDPAAQAIGVSLKTAQGLGRDGLLSAAEVGADAAAASPDAQILNDPRVRRAVFSPQVLTEKHNSGVIEISPDTMLAVRVQNIKPAHIPALELVSDRIRQHLVAQRAHDLAVKAGQDHLSALSNEAGSLSDVPEGFGDPLTVSRVSAQNVDKQVLDAAMALNAHKVPGYTGVEGAQGFVIVRVEQVTAGQADASVLAALPSELKQLWGQAEEQAVLKAMRVQANVEVLPEAEDVITKKDGAE